MRSSAYKKIAAAIMLSMLLSLCSCSDAYYEYRLKKASRELDEYCSDFPTCLRMTSDKDPDNYTLFDLTGDGNDDLVTSFVYGSGIVRDTIVVYDATDKTFYQFYNQMDSYRIVEFEDDRIVVEAWIYSGGTELGTLGIEDGYLVFIPDDGEVSAK